MGLSSHWPSAGLARGQAYTDLGGRPRMRCLPPPGPGTARADRPGCGAPFLPPSPPQWHRPVPPPPSSLWEWSKPPQRPLRSEPRPLRMRPVAGPLLGGARGGNGRRPRSPPAPPRRGPPPPRRPQGPPRGSRRGAGASAVRFTSRELASCGVPCGSPG